MQIRYAHAKRVFEVMLAQYRTQAHPFRAMEKDLPQYLVLPEIRACPKRHARHLFFACHYMRGTVVSSHAFVQLNEMWRQHPWLFTEDILLMTNRQMVTDTLLSFIPWQSEQVGRLWLENAHTLDREWGNDPRNIFTVSAKKALYRRIIGKKMFRTSRYAGFGGFQKKMASMLAYFLAAEKLIEPTTLSAPIDFHHFRVYLATQMIEIDVEAVRYEKVRELGIRLAEYLQSEFNLSQVEYGDIVWLWSLRLCRHAPVNRTREQEEGSRVREIVPVTWTKAQVAQFARSCGTCAIAPYCKYGVPSGTYYTTGVFRLLLRELPPQSLLFVRDDLPVQVKSKKTSSRDKAGVSQSVPEKPLPQPSLFVDDLPVQVKTEKSSSK